MSKRNNPCREAVFELDPMVNDLEFALDNISVIHSAMVESASQIANHYGNALYCMLEYLTGLQERMRDRLDITFDAMQTARE